MLFGLLVGGGSWLGRGVDRGLTHVFEARLGLESLPPKAKDSILLNRDLALKKGTSMACSITAQAVPAALDLPVLRQDLDSQGAGAMHTVLLSCKACQQSAGGGLVQTFDISKSV